MLRSIRAFIKSYASSLAALIPFIFWISYLLISYHQISQNSLHKNQGQFFAECKEIKKSLALFNEYLTLVEFRLLNSDSKLENIQAILDWRPEALMGNIFPIIKDINFHPSSNSTHIYSRFRDISLNTTFKGPCKDKVTYLGKGEFKIHRVISDRNGKLFGCLETIFSINHLLNKFFDKDKIHVIINKDSHNQGSQFILKILNASYSLIYKPHQKSLWSFILAYKLEISLSLVFGIITLFLGWVKGKYYHYKIRGQVSARNKITENKLFETEQEKRNATSQLIALQKTLELKDEAYQRLKSLSRHIQKRYQNMAKEAQAINLVTSKLVEEVGGNTKIKEEIHSIAQENNIILRHLANGYLMKDSEEYINIAESIEDIKAIFLPEIKEKNIQFDIKNPNSINLYTDKLTFEIIIYNILSLIMGRLMKNNMIKISVEEKDSIRLTFLDNGYDIGETIEKIACTKEPEQALSMSKKMLRDYVHYLGWDLFFSSKQLQSNSIELLIPYNLTSKKLPDNVVSLFNDNVQDA